MLWLCPSTMPLPAMVLLHTKIFEVLSVNILTQRRAAGPKPTQTLRTSWSAKVEKLELVQTGGTTRRHLKILAFVSVIIAFHCLLFPSNRHNRVPCRTTQKTMPIFGVLLGCVCMCVCVCVCV